MIEAMMSAIEHWLFWGYGFLGVGVWCLVWFGMIKGQARLDLRRGKRVELGQWPRVTVVVACRNEQDHIRDCVEGILSQDYPNVELIVVNDRSEDRTAEVLREIRDHRLKVLEVKELPVGWFGKTHAMWLGARAGEGEWLVFTDSDTRLCEGALREGIGLGVIRGFDMVSLVPRFRTRGFSDSLLTPLCGMMTSGMYSIMFANHAQLPGVAFACGQYMAIRREAYEQAGGWESLKGYPSDDVEMARRMKRMGMRPRVGWGQDLVEARMYEGWGQVYRGWSRNLIMASRGHPWRVLGAVMFVLLGVMSSFAALGWGLVEGHQGWVLLSLGHMILITLVLWSGYERGRFQRPYALLWPIGMLLLLLILVRSLYLCWRGGMEWRGVWYSFRTA